MNRWIPASLLCIACNASTLPPNTEVLNNGVLLTTMTYEVDWSWRHATETPHGWTVTTNTGDELHISSAYLVNYSIQLIPCDTSTARRSQPLWSPRVFFPLVSVANAGHSGSDDESITPRSVVEDFSKPVPRAIATVSFEPNLYCQIHYLIGRADESTEDLPDDVEMTGKSVYVQGARTQDDSEEVPFEITSSLAHGIVIDLPDTLDSSSNHLQLVRDMDALFDEFPWDGTDADMSWQFLHNIIEGTTIRAAQ